MFRQVFGSQRGGYRRQDAAEPHRRARRTPRRLLATAIVGALALAGITPAALADQQKRTIATGVAAAGLLVDPSGRVWVSDRIKGFCRVTETTATSAGGIETSTCLGGTAGGTPRGPARPGAPALFDPTPQSSGSGDELALVPDSATGSSKVVKARWSPVSGRFAYASTLTVFGGGDLRPVGVAVGPDRSAYVAFERTRSVVRIVDPGSTQPTIDVVGSTAGTGARAIAAGDRDGSGRVILYVAEASALTSLAAPTAGSSTQTAATSFAVGSVARLHFDAQARTLYAGTASATSTGGDSITRVDVPAGRVEPNWATGFTRVGGIALRGSLVLVADDPAQVVTGATGSVYVLGEVLPRIVAGPTMADGTPAPDPTITNDSTPSFSVAVDGAVALQCAFDGNWAGCAPGEVRASTPLADGAHRFAVRIGATGAPVERAFTVDTTPPPAPTITSPAPGSTVGGSIVLAVTAEAGASLRCVLDGTASTPGTACASGQTLTVTTPGAHTLRVTAVDRVGNVGATAESSFTVDLSSPAPVITSPASNGQTLTGTARFEFSAGTDPALTYRCRIDAQSFEACTSPKVYTSLSAGAHTFTVEARNAAGNTGTASRTFQYVPQDSSPPVVTASPAGGTYDAGQQITLTANEPATIRYTIDGSTPSSSSPAYAAPIVLSANFTLRYFAVDSAGNASAPGSQTYVVRTGPPPSGDRHDFDGDSNVDIVALNGSGVLWLYRSDGRGGWLGWHAVASGLGDVNALVTPGDWNGDGHPDVLARSTGGELRLFRGDSAGNLAAPQVIATGWGGLSMLFGPGDWDGDGRVDVMARNSSGGLILHPGDGSGGFLPARTVGTGWQGMTAIFGPGDWNGDGRPDVLARNSSGALLLYRGNGTGGWLGSSQVGSGWNIMTAILGPGDWDGDGRPDVLARDGSGRLLLYPGNGSGGWLASRQIGSGWGGMTVIS